jgi:hypothetical protein
MLKNVKEKFRELTRSSLHSFPPSRKMLKAPTDPRRLCTANA